jgi:glycosidase
MARPDKNDWYETAKINYGVRPDGGLDFPNLPWGYDTESYEKHHEFWKDKEVPNSWYKFRDIALYWTKKGIDGFRYDMAELVPFEFWSFMNSSIKMKNPDAFLLAEVYNPDAYYNYIKMGKMDYLYDKVGTYDKLKDVIQGRSWPDELTQIQYGLWNISHHMLKFLDNHDEQRVASPEFAGSGEKGKPMMVVSATISTAPVMIYFGQEVGEAANENSGFGTHSRTSIFDYVGVPSHQRWVNNGKYDGGQLTTKEVSLRDFYKRLLNFTLESSALMGDFQEIQFANRYHTQGYDTGIYSYTRWSVNQKLVVVANFSADTTSTFELKIPNLVIEKWGLKEAKYKLTDQLYQKTKLNMQVVNGEGLITMQLAPLESLILEVQ